MMIRTARVNGTLVRSLKYCANCKAKEGFVVNSGQYETISHDERLIPFIVD